MTHSNVNLIGLSLMTVALAAVVAPSAQAQSLTTDVGIAVGGVFPLGDRLRAPQQFGLDGPLGGLDVAGGARTGFTIAGSVGIRPVNSLVSYRLEAQYTRFGLDPEGRFGPGGAPETADGHLSSLGGIANLVVTVPIASRIRPYVIGGAGGYRVTSDIIQEPNSTFGPSSVTKFGLNGGAGLEFSVGSLRTFVEGRFHSIFTEGERVSFVPITLGMRF